MREGERDAIIDKEGRVGITQRQQARAGVRSSSSSPACLLTHLISSRMVNKRSQDPG